MLIGLIGCGGFGREVMPILRERQVSTRDSATLVFVDTSAMSGSVVNGHRVLSEQEFLRAEYDNKKFNVAIGNSIVREKVAERFLKAGIQPFAVHSSHAALYDSNQIGEGSIICAGCIVTSNARIGRFFHCNLQSYVAHDCVVGDFVTFAPRVACNGNVVIEDHAYIGTGAVLRQGTKEQPLKIGRGAIVGMGAIVTRDVPAGETWVGNPARPIDRNR